VSEYVEDVRAVVRERDGLRVRVHRLEIENGRLRAIIAGYGEKVKVKETDARTSNNPAANRKAIQRAHRQRPRYESGS